MYDANVHPANEKADQCNGETYTRMKAADIEHGRESIKTRTEFKVRSSSKSVLPTDCSAMTIPQSNPLRVSQSWNMRESWSL